MAAKKKSSFRLWLFIALFLVSGALVLPWGFYYYGLYFLDSLPEPGAEIQSRRLPRGLAAPEKAEIKSTLAQNRFEPITPYWIYRLALASLANDALELTLSDSFLKGSLATLAERTAHAYITNDHYQQGAGQARWHLVNWSLSIWIQRNTTPKQALALWRDEQPNDF